tara:strand:+ start:1779 stop:3746 length:1968 start_codon:yes stop_codon:yes gene_type:complete
MAEKVILKVEVESAKASKDIKKVGDGAKASAKETTLLTGAMAAFKSGMIAARATSKILFGSIKAGLISTGIGAFVVIIGSLIGYLMNTKAGAEKLEHVMAAVGAAIAVITDRISQIGGAIAKVFSGDFVGAAKDVKGALSGIGDEIMEEASAAMRLKKELQALKDATRELSLEKAKATQEIEKAMLITVDETKTNDEKLEALKRALELEKEVTEQSLALQQRRVAAIEEEVSLGESLEEDFQKLTDEKIRLIELETASIKMQKKVATQVLAFERKIEADRIAVIKAASDARKVIREQEKKDAEKLAQETADATLKINNKSTGILQKMYYSQLKTKEEVEKAKLYTTLQNAEEEIEASKASDVAKYKALGLLTQQWNIDKKAITDKYDDLQAKAEQSSADRLLLMSQDLTLALTEDLNERALAAIEIERNKELSDIEGMANNAALKEAINKKYNQKVTAQNKATSDASRKFEAADLAAIGGLFGQAASMQHEGTEGWKKNKIAEARIGSIMGAMSAFNSLASIPFVGVPLGIIAAGMALKQGQEHVNTINATEIPKMARGGMVGGYGNGTSDSVNAKLSRGEVVINAKSAKMFRGALSNMNVAGGGVGFARGGATSEDVGGAISGLSTEPVQAFVLTDSLTDSQDKMAAIRRRSKL